MGTWSDARDQRQLARRQAICGLALAVDREGVPALTEAEWEYAARAGAMTRYSWGDDPRGGNANCDGCGSRWDRQQTAPVGSLKPNAFGLHDMLGNVWEWVEDSWHENYNGAPTDARRRGLAAAIRTTALSAVAPGVTRANSSARPPVSGATSMCASILSESESLER